LDDDNEDCGRIASFLRQALGIPVEGVLNRDEALRKFKLARDYDLVVVDVRLKNARRKPENGSEAAKELLDLVPDLTVVFTSSDPLVDKYYTTIYGRQYPFVAKGKDSTAILECIHDLCAGRWEEVHETRPQIHSDSSTLEHQLGLELIARRTLPETLQVMLKKLRLDTQTSHAAVFELDSTSKTVSLVAVDPPLQEEQQKAILDGLYYSPIQNVVLDEMPINETDVIQRGYRRFRSLFPIVPFRSFFGLPLTVPDLVTRHALFLFDENRREIEATDLSKARQTAMLMQIAIERSMLIDYMRRFELRYTLGQLLGSLVHELDNRLDSLGSNIDALPAVLDRVGAINEPIRRKTEIAEVHKIVSALTQDKTQLEELLDAYSRLVSGDFEAVNVADLLNRVKLQMDTKARDAKTEIHLVIPSSLPTVRAIASRLEQVVINLVLNSIHQIEQQNDTMEQVSCDQRHGSNLATSGQIILQAQYDERNRPDSVKIRVVDTGPGVHYHQQRWIFLLDTSRRRRGRGLGLFISRNLTEMMGGRLYLDDTLLFMGSSFAVELPLATQNGRR
jgi:signal transduction histidine kinase/CheY-like chemotaxis protein